MTKYDESCLEWMRISINFLHENGQLRTQGFGCACALMDSMSRNPTSSEMFAISRHRLPLSFRNRQELDYLEDDIGKKHAVDAKATSIVVSSQR